MVIVVTGMVGIDKKQYLEDVVALAGVKGQQVSLCNVGDMMYTESPDIAPGRILDIPLQRLRSIRRSVFKDIIAKSKGPGHLIVNTHATFRWRHGLFPAIDFDQIRQLKPDMYVCMIDGADALHYRLASDHPVNHTLKDLLVWREEEMLATEMMQQAIDPAAEFYCMARGRGGDTVQTFYDLAFEAGRKKAYLSFPMTHVMDMPDVIAEIAEFRLRMRDDFICFDPGDLEEAYLPCWARRAQERGEDYIEIETLGQKIRLDVDQVLQIESDINSQIYARDFALIDQADMIISYIPELADGMPAISSGVERELQHAHEAGKDVYVIWPAKNDPSVFVTQTATKVFREIAEAVDYLVG